MADYIDREALGIGLCNPNVFENKAYAEGWNSAIRIMHEAPASDVVQVVRCKDCIHWKKDFPGATDTVRRCEWAGYAVGANGFCVYGERKDK